MKWIVALLIAVLVTSCASHALLWPMGSPLTIIDDYQDAHVRVYRSGSHCRIEVITLTTTIYTLVTQCAIAPHRATP